MCWSANTLGICRSIGKPRCWPPRASTSNARCSRSGWAMRRLSSDRFTLGCCWAHLRRKFFDIAKGGNAPIASEALERIAELYAIEKTIRGMTADERSKVRQDKSKPLIAALKSWLEHQLERVSAKAPIAEEIRYGLNHWDGLTRFVDDGRIELDTNSVERGIRPIVLN